MKKSDATNIESVTMLRGLASLAVCFAHFSGTTGSEALMQIGKIGFSGVPIFFAISGFILPYALSKANYSLAKSPNFILKRIVRLEPPYILSIVGIVLLSIIAQFSNFHTAPIIDLFSFRTLLHVFYLVEFFNESWYNPVFWTLAIEFQFYLLVAVIFPLLQHPKLSIKIILFCSLASAPFLFNDGRVLTHYLLAFLPGIILFWFYTKQISSIVFSGFLFILIILGFLKSGIEAPLCALTTISFILFVKQSYRWLLFLGTISYSLYLIHTPFGTDGMINFFQNYIHSENGKIALMIVVLPCTIFAAWLFYRIIEKPSIHWSKRIKW